MRFQLSNTYQKELDTVQPHYVAIPCLVLGLLVRLGSEGGWLGPPLYSTSVFVEAVSVLPQLMLMRKNQVTLCLMNGFVVTLV